MSRREAASYRHLSVATVQYWVARARRASAAERENGKGAEDRPSTPHRQPARVSEEVHDRVCRARRRTGWGPRLIFEWPCPGDLLQMDTKRLARFTRPGHAVTGDRYRSAHEKRNGPGWEFCHSVIDDHSRLAYTEIHRDERAATVTGSVARALAFVAGHGITARRLQTDNAYTYIHNRSLRELLAERGI